MSKKKKIKPKDNWRIPENAADYFDPSYDDKFKREHPVLYVLTVIAILICVLVAPITYIILSDAVQPGDANTVEFKNFFEFAVWIVGFIASFGIGIGICNLLMIIHKQYLGHYVTVFSFAIGIFGSLSALILLWLI